MNSVLNKIEVTCPQCGRKLNVPDSAVGKQGRCPGCARVFPIEKRMENTLDQADLALQSLSSQTTTAMPSPYSPPLAAPEPTKNYNHGFGWEHRGWDNGMVGGLAMMAIAALWFFGGLACGIIFYYPPILFVIGLVGFFRGLFTGNVAGK